VNRAVGRKVTLIVQLLPALRLVPHVVVWLKSPAFVPVSDMLIPVRVVVSTFLTVTVWAALVVPTVWVANVSLVGVTLTPVPVPVSDTVCGLPGALSAIETEAVRVPAAVGRNVTLIVQLALTASVVPQVVVRAKSPEFEPVIVIPVIDIVALPLLRRVIALAALVVFTGWIV
jgi:hypothetical protein